MDNSIFQINDRVYHAFRGWGTIFQIANNNTPLVSFDNDRSEIVCYAEARLLSFTEYSFEKGGFSQDRSNTVMGKWCKVWDDNFDYLRIAKITQYIKEDAYPYNSDHTAWKNAIILDEETVQFLLNKNIISDGDDTGDNRNS